MTIDQCTLICVTDTTQEYEGCMLVSMKGRGTDSQTWCGFNEEMRCATVNYI